MMNEEQAVTLAKESAELSKEIQELDKLIMELVESFETETIMKLCLAIQRVHPDLQLEFKTDI